MISLKRFLFDVASDQVCLPEDRAIFKVRTSALRVLRSTFNHSANTVSGLTFDTTDCLIFRPTKTQNASKRNKLIPNKQFDCLNLSCLMWCLRTCLSNSVTITVEFSDGCFSGQWLYLYLISVVGLGESDEDNHELAKRCRTASNAFSLIGLVVGIALILIFVLRLVPLH